MKNKLDCKEIHREALAILCYDFRSQIDLLIGYSDLLHYVEDDDTDVVEILTIMQSMKRALESILNTAVEYMLPYADDCKASSYTIHDPVEATIAIHQSDLKIWFDRLEELKINYDNTHHLNRKLIASLQHHATNLDNFNQEMLDKYRVHYP